MSLKCTYTFPGNAKRINRVSGVKLIQTDLNNSLKLMLLFLLGKSVTYEIYHLRGILSSAAHIFKGEKLFWEKRRKCTIKQLYVYRHSENESCFKRSGVFGMKLPKN